MCPQEKVGGGLFEGGCSSGVSGDEIVVGEMEAGGVIASTSVRVRMRVSGRHGGCRRGRGGCGGHGQGGDSGCGRPRNSINVGEGDPPAFYLSRGKLYEILTLDQKDNALFSSRK